MAVLGGLKRRERISARLGDILRHLYLASATLKRFEDDGRPAMDLPIVEWVIKRLSISIRKSHASTATKLSQSSGCYVKPYYHFSIRLSLCAT